MTKKYPTRRYSLVVTAMALAAVAMLIGCQAAQIELDNWSLKENEKHILQNFQPGDPGQLAKFIAAFNLKTDTAPEFADSIQSMPLDKWHVSQPPGHALTFKKFIFPSRIRHAAGPDRAVFYAYRHIEGQPRDVILWVPGMAVSDAAFHLIKHLFSSELDHGYDIVFYVPPYHLDRREPGKDNGEGFFTADVQGNIQLFLETVRELRTMVQYLQSQGVRRIGGWGGSMGATMLLLTAQTVKLDFLCLTIPVLNWETIFSNHDTMGDLATRLEANGYGETLLKKAFALISPLHYGPGADPRRTLIQFARYDQLTPPTVIAEYARDNGISNLIGYNRSHATILLTPTLYADHDRFLDSVQRIGDSLSHRFFLADPGVKRFGN